MNLNFSPRSLNVIASLGLKPANLFKISFQEFLKQNPDLKKLSKDIQKQRYEFYEEERQGNIKRCIQERQNIIAITSKKMYLKKNKSFEKNELDSDGELNELKKSDNSVKSKKSNYKIFSQKNKKILMTEDSYIMNNNDGSKALITREDLEKITCLQKEKSKLDKKIEQREEYLVRFLKGELNREKKLQKVKNKISEREKKINNFLKNKNDNIKLMENGRYQDNQDVYERQKLYEKMFSNIDKKIFITKKQQQEQNSSNSVDYEKMNDLKRQIEDYERKNQQYKERITNLFDLKDKQEMEEKKFKEKKFNANNPDLGTRKLQDLEEKAELERFRRENALMTNFNTFQNKINNILQKKEEKEKKIKKTIEKEEKKKEEKRILQTIHYEEVRNNVKKNQKKLEKERTKKLQNLEKKDLKDFAIKQEKIKLYEERKKMNQQSYEERKAMRERLKEILKEEKNIDSNENDENIINKVLNN